MLSHNSQPENFTANRTKCASNLAHQARKDKLLCGPFYPHKIPIKHISVEIFSLGFELPWFWPVNLSVLFAHLTSDIKIFYDFLAEVEAS